jgi:hypothetical protein
VSGSDEEEEEEDEEEEEEKGHGLARPIPDRPPMLWSPGFLWDWPAPQACLVLKTTGVV